MSQAASLFKKNFKKKYILRKYPIFIKTNTASGIDKLQKKNFDKISDEQIDVIINKVNNDTYRFTYYKERLILKNRNSLPRMISIPSLRDRIVLKLLHEILMKSFNIELKLVQTVISEFTEESKKYDSYIKIDISNFFGSLNHDVLLKKTNSKVRKKELRNLISSAIKNPTVNSSYRRSVKIEENTVGVPQGIPIANVLAEIYFKELDEKYKARNNISYFRYVDDILILCNSEDVGEIKAEITQEIIETYKLCVNEDKCDDGLIAAGMTYLGYKFYKVSGNIICTVKEESLAKMENSLVALFSKFKNSEGKMKHKELIFYLNLKITGAIVKELDDNEVKDLKIRKKDMPKDKKFGWLFFYSQINDIRKLYHLDYLVKVLIKRYDTKNELKVENIKSFVKAYYEITQRRNKSKYIFNPSKLTMQQKKELLVDTFSMNKSDLITVENIEYHFNKKVKRKIDELEMDIQGGY